MIKESDLTKAGTFTKTHGVRGELNALLDIDPDYFESHDCFICMEEGIPTPFFVESFRPKGTSASLIKPENVDSEEEAKLFVGKSIYIDKKQYREYLDENPDSEGEYASDLIGWSVIDSASGEKIGTIVDLNLDTANPLFIVEAAADASRIMIPVAEEFITDMNDEDKTINMSLPEGLLGLNAEL